MKSFLENVGVPVKKIKGNSHDLRALLKEVGECEVEVEISPGIARWVPATRVRSIEIQFQGYSSTLGVIISAEDHGASQYPSELRYGEMPKDFPPQALFAASLALADWVGEFWERARNND